MRRCTPHAPSNQCVLARFGVRTSTTLLLTGSPLADNRFSERADIHENSAYYAISFMNYLRCYSVLRARPESWRVLLEVCRLVGIEESRFHRRWKYSEAIHL